MLIRASAVDSNVPAQKVNRDNRIMVGGTLTLHISLQLILIYRIFNRNLQKQ
jgi:hypothetical protein